MVPPGDSENSGPSDLDAFELLEPPRHVERIAGIARALHVELGPRSMVEIVTFGRMATRTAAPDVGPTGATLPARDRLVARVRDCSAAVVEGAGANQTAMAFGVPVLVDDVAVAVVTAWFAEPVPADETVSLVELAAIGLGGWWERQEQRRGHDSSRIFDGARARERERRRLAYDLHGSVAQELAAARISAETAEMLSSEPADSRAFLPRVRKHIELAQAQTRRLINALGARSPDEETPAEIVEGLCREYEHKLNVRRRVQLTLSVSRLPEAASSELSEALAFVLREVLQNVYEHANASRVDVVAAFRDGEIALSVTDNGVGFGPSGERDDNLHLGMAGIRERVRVIGGTVSVRSRQGAGTKVTAAFPTARDVLAAVPPRD